MSGYSSHGNSETLCIKTQLHKSKKIKKNHKDFHEYTAIEIEEIEKEYKQIKKQSKNVNEPKVQNIVTTVVLQMKSKDGEDINKINLDNLAHFSQNCEYKKSRFPAVIQRIKEPKATALIFECGKMVITGTKGQKEAEEAARKFSSNIGKINKISVNITNIQTSNIVANGQFPYEVNLNNVNEDKQLKDSVQYDRQFFPGLIYKLQNPKLAALIFYSGKIVFTGAKNEIQIKDAFVKLFNILKKHQTIKK